MIRRSHSFHLLFAFAFLALTACTNKEMAPRLEVIPEPALGPTQNCTVGTNLSFPLEVVVDSSGNYNPDYTMKLATGTYNTDGCLCEVTAYRLEFQEFSKGNTVSVTDGAGFPVTFSEVPIDQPGGVAGVALVITNIGDLPGPVATVNVDFSGNHEPLINAGGLCVIENFGGGDPVNPANLPLTEFVTTPPPGYIKYFIPTSIASPI